LKAIFSIHLLTHERRDTGTDLEDDGIDLPDFDDRGCNTLTTIVVSEQDVIDVLNILDPNKAVGPNILH
jgi:hypothetical protein